MSISSAVVPRSPCRRCGVAHANRNGYCDKHKDLAVGWSIKQKAKTTTQRGYGHAWRKLRAVILIRDKHCCIPCKALGFIVAAYAVDHIVSKEDRGTDDPSNLQSICKGCHKLKTQAEALSGRKKW